MASIRTTVLMIAIAGIATGASAQVSTYDDLTEGFLGTSYTYNGVKYSGVNGVDGVFPDGSTFLPSDTGDQLIIENAGYLYNDFPTWGSASNALNFGSAFIPGQNLSLGAFSRVTMDLEAPASQASIQMAFYENGPWGGITFHMDALLNGQVVDSTSFKIANGGGRDNIAFQALSVSAASFDQIKIYAMYGNEYSAPRLIVDNLDITTVPAPMSALAFAGLAGAMGRRRR
jgi:hypothetical protein